MKTNTNETPGDYLRRTLKDNDAMLEVARLATEDQREAMIDNTKNEMKLCTRIDGCTCPGVHRSENMTHNTREVEETLDRLNKCVVMEREGDLQYAVLDYKKAEPILHHQLQKVREEERKRIWKLIEQYVSYEEDSDTMYFDTRATALGMVDDYKQLEKAINHSELDQDKK